MVQISTFGLGRERHWCTIDLYEDDGLARLGPIRTACSRVTS